MKWLLLEVAIAIALASAIAFILTTLHLTRDECEGKHQVKYERCF